MTEPSFDAGFRETLRRLFEWRRDVRHFRRDPIPAGDVERLIGIACLSPSVGLSQPWRFVIVRDAARRHQIRANFESCNAAALTGYTGERAALYARLKLAGLDDAPEQLAVFADPVSTTGHGLGRRTMPETIEFSVVAAIHALMLAARAEGIGTGWLSILDPAALAISLDVPPAWVFIGYLCLGYPETPDDTPMLQRAGWEQRRPAAEFIYRR
ncbi:MAG: 5,6-dimethylbenzimidazole synthase [Alphaproteobacteria bacterium]|nr:5,6-dimethylbenzimidazole synthase [Alphaproteobacteria bacterium]